MTQDLSTQLAQLKREKHLLQRRNKRLTTRVEHLQRELKIAKSWKERWHSMADKVSETLLDILPQKSELESAVNQYLDGHPAMRRRRNEDEEEEPEERRETDEEHKEWFDKHSRIIARLCKAVGRKVPRPDFEDDDLTWHWGITPDEAEEEWLQIWGEVAEPKESE